MSRIRKAREISGSRLLFTDVTVADAEFILDLRLDSRRNAHLSPVIPELDAQRRWIENYGRSEGQAYFIIRTAAEREPLGTVRLYDQQGDSFSWGSWILKPDAPNFAAIESALMVYRYALDHLGFSAAHFAVNKPNTSVWGFHERFGAVRTAENESEYFYSITAESIERSCERYRRMLPAGSVTVVPI